MNETWRRGVILVFLAGLVLAGLVGTSTSMTFVWPAYALLGLAGALSAGLLFRKAHHSLPPWLGASALVALAALLALAWHSPVSYLARADLALVVSAFLVYGLFISLLGSADSRHRFVEALALVVAINLALALAQAALHPTLWIVPGYERTFADRVGGLFNHPDHFAAFLAMLAPLWIACAAFGRRSAAVRLAFASLAAVSALVVLLVGGMAATLGLLAGLVILGALALALAHSRLKPETKRTGHRAAGIAAVLVGLAALVCSGPIGRLLDRELLSKRSGLSLPLVWEAGWRQFAESPLVGTGSRTTEIHARLHRHEALAADLEPEFAHSEYLQLLADYGLLGFAALLAAIALHLASGLRFVRSYIGFAGGPQAALPRSDHLALVLGALGSLAALATLAAFDFIFHLPVFALAAAGLLAALAVPDPMADALKPAPAGRLLPVDGILLAKRALVFVSGLALLLIGARFSRSEYHYEMARLSFEVEPQGYHHHRHLRAARDLDPSNPWLFALSGHAEVAGIRSGMAEPERRQALQQAETHFERARRLHPRDPFAAIGHAAVLEELGRPQEALARLREARGAAPFHGNLMLAEAEHHLRNGRIVEAEAAYRAAVNARAYRDIAAAQRGLSTVTEWKLIAESRGIDWKIAPDPVESEPLLAGSADRILPEALVSSVAPAGLATPEDAPPAEAGSTVEEETDSVEMPKGASPMESPESIPPASVLGLPLPQNTYEYLFVPFEFGNEGDFEDEDEGEEER
jgi:O-antigen ligase